MLMPGHYFAFICDKMELNPGTLGIKELSIPCPWGHMSAKAWGDPEKGQKVLAIHGWMDNAGSFDRLFPLLPRSLYIVALELPGHGRSSHYPTGIMYHYVDFFAAIRRVVKNFLKWDKYWYIGHSMGGLLGIMYACMWPDEIERLVLLDQFKCPMDEPKEALFCLRDGVGAFLSLDKAQKAQKKEPVGYPYEEAISRLVNSTNFSNYKISEIGAKTMLIRGSQQLGEYELTFCRDHRLMCMNTPPPVAEQYFDYLANLKARLLIVKAKDSDWSKNAVYNKTLELYEKMCPDFRLIEVPGNHFVHINKPEVLAVHIVEFFTDE